jgi:hypothetical protein
MTALTYRTLDSSYVLALADLVNGVRGSTRVRWMAEWAFGGVAEGTLRHFTAESGSAGFQRDGQDLRDAHLRVTTNAGMEVWLSVAEAVEMLSVGTMVVDFK